MGSKDGNQQDVPQTTDAAVDNAPAADVPVDIPAPPADLNPVTGAMVLYNEPTEPKADNVASAPFGSSPKGSHPNFY